MAASLFKMLMLMVVLAYMSFDSSLGIVHHVGDDDFGWKIQENPNFYDNWQSQRTFNVGDILFFGFVTGYHDVSKVNKQQFDNCETPDLRSIIAEGPALINLTERGDHYYFCSYHCNHHQKLAIHVL
ncbi:umecyanin-like [Rutidosis leptorrhynchoides]|uniref:umecyanin-like n=1 Tax=Rutidosis leptorrhynchoides TaxID=125765 RepID=UPI003A99EBB0